MRTIFSVVLLSFAMVLPIASNAAAPPPVYPGAAAAAAPAGLGLKALPKSAKSYVTADAFTTVRAWYRTKLKGVPEMAQPDKEDSMDAFLLGSGPTATIVMVQRFNGKTWIVIGPPA